MAKVDKKDKKEKSVKVKQVAPAKEVIKPVKDGKKKDKKAAAPAPAPPAKKSKKAAALPPPKPESSSSESDSDDEPPVKAKVVVAPKAATSDESSESESEDEKPKAAQVKPPVTATTTSDSDSDSDSEDEAPKTKAKAVPAKVVAAATSSSDSDDSDDETPKKAVVAAAATTSDSDDSDSDDEPAKKPVAKKAAADSDSDDSDSDSDDDEDVKMGDATKKTVAPVTNGKRKATDDAPAPPKKVKLANGDAAPAGSSEICNVFVGQLSWAVDDARLASEFADCGEVLSAHVQLDRNTGRSRGFGYINFSTPEAAQKALTYAGKEIDGRPINVDLSTPKPTEDRQNDRAKKFGDSTSSPSQTLFVGNLSFDATEDVVWEFFGEHAPVKSVRLPTDRETGRPKGFGYVEFESLDGATTAFEAASGAEIAGRMIRLDYSQPRDASGGGGGRGGFGGDRGGRGGGRGFGGDRGGRGGGRGFGDRGGGRGGRGGFGDRGGRGGGRGRGAPNPRTGGIVHSDGGKKKITF